VWIFLCLGNYNKSYLLEVPFKFSDSIRLDKLPSWIRSENVQKEIGPSNREDLEDVVYALIIDYDAEVLGEKDEVWLR
jgi:hypothetical protein